MSTHKILGVIMCELIKKSLPNIIVNIPLYNKTDLAGNSKTVCSFVGVKPLSDTKYLSTNNKSVKCFSILNKSNMQIKNVL